jgi:CHAD domain-containing protein/CYTH domain-containing protein
VPEYPHGLLDRTPAQAVQVIGLHLLDEARAARRRVHDPLDAEGLHDFRVALRRLRSVIRAFRPQVERGITRGVRRRLRALQRATNRARDGEVQIAWLAGELPTLTRTQRAGARWLKAELDAIGHEAYAETRARIDADFPALDRRVRRGLVTVARATADEAGPTFGAVAARCLREAMAELNDCLADLAGADDEPQVHAARIAAKRLRYVAEVVAGDVAPAAGALEALKTLQAALGDWHDAQVFDARLAEATERAAAQHARRLRDLPPGDRQAREQIRRLNATPGVLALARRARAAAIEHHRAFTRWRDASSRGLAVALTESLALLGPPAGPGSEIERKYLLSRLPQRACEAPVAEVEQGFIPGTELVERVRRVRRGDHEELVRTVKLGAGIQRIEVEEPTTPEIFGHLWPLTEGHRVRKRRYYVTDGAYTWEIDEFLDRELVLAEVELPSPDVEPAIPDWLRPSVVREVTGEPEYLNMNLAR